MPISTSNPSAQRLPAVEAQPIPRLSLLDDLLYNLASVVPNYLQGSFTRRRFWVSLFSCVHPDPLAVRLGSYLRRKYRSDYLSLHLLTTRSLLVLDPAGIQRVLERSPSRYADPRLKRQGMSHFQPHALTISRGEEWKERRRFNEAVLESRQRIHSGAGHFLKLIAEEVEPLRAREYLEWRDFERLFERLALGLIFGESARKATGLTDRLRRMMRESNRVFALRKSRHFDPFYDEVRARLSDPEEGSLVARCRQVPATETTRVENQIPHWTFALGETLATNTLFALALIASHPVAQERVRQELAGHAPRVPEEVDRLRYLEGCVQEGMRLWPTTATLLREALTDEQLYGRHVPAGTQVVIHNGINHRDRTAHAFADLFTPEYWLDGKVDPLFNHLSNGPQVCAGKALALFVAKAVLSRLLERHRYTLSRPSLDPSRPLPYAFDYFRVRLKRASPV
jgi:cytochrome P450